MVIGIDDALAGAGIVTSAAKLAGDAIGSKKKKKLSKKIAKESKRQTYAELLNSVLQNQAELQGQNLDSSRRLGAARTRGLMDTAATMRGAFQ